MLSGTTKIENLEANTASLRVKLKAEELKEIGEAIPVDQVGGDRDIDTFTKFAYKLANTPPYEKWYCLIPSMNKYWTQQHLNKHEAFH